MSAATATSKMYRGNVSLREVAMLASTADIGREAVIGNYVA
jgi:hypothetical protein